MDILLQQVFQYADLLIVGLFPLIGIFFGVRLVWAFMDPVFKAAAAPVTTPIYTPRITPHAPTNAPAQPSDGLTPMQRELVKLLRQYLAVQPCGHCGTPLNQWHPNCPNCGAPRGR